MDTVPDKDYQSNNEYVDPHSFYYDKHTQKEAYPNKEK